MRALAKFKHVHGRNGKVESICMNCLLAVAICSSDEELLAKESAHQCPSTAPEVKPRKLEADRPDRVVTGLFAERAGSNTSSKDTGTAIPARDIG